MSFHSPQMLLQGTKINSLENIYFFLLQFFFCLFATNTGHCVTVVLHGYDKIIVMFSCFYDNY